MALPGFLYGGNTGETPQSLAKKRAVVEALLMGRGAPKTVGEGLLALGDGIAANVLGRRADSAERQGNESATAAIAALLGGSEFPPAPAAPLAPALSDEAKDFVASNPQPGGFGADVETAANSAPGDMSGYRSAIASIESAGSGDYSAVGPTHPELGRALGKYQVMEANIGPWSKAALGQALTPEQFLADAKAQDAVFDHVFGGYVQEYGPEGAAQAWFAGPGGVGKVNRKDSLGTNVGEYGQRFMSALGGGNQVAQAQPQTMTDLPEMAGNAPAQVGGPSLQQLIQAAQNPWLSDGQRAVVNTMLQQKMQQQDPMRQLQLRKLQMEIDNAGKPERPWWVRPDGTVDPAYIEGQRAGKPETNVTVGGGKYGTIPQGYMLRENGPQGAQLVPIPGGPAAMETEAAARAEENRRSGQVERSGLVAEEIDRALGVMGTGILPDTGVGAWLSGLPGTDAKALSSRLDTIKANIGFEELNKMRQESPTGGALGQVTERELAFLQSVAGSLDQAQSDGDLRYNLNRLWNAYMETIHGPGNFAPRELGKAPANAKGNRTSGGVEWSID